MRTTTCTLISILCSTVLMSQQLEVTLNSNNICAGQNVTATVQAAEVELPTPNSTANNNSGFMFDVVATNPCIITGFEANVINSGTDIKVFYKTGSFVGHETNPSSWTVLDSSSNIPAGMGNLGFNLSQPIVAGQTLAFYITSTTSGNYIYYDNGTAVDTTLASDGNLTVEEGVGKTYPFGATNTTRNFVGKVLYRPVVSNISWNVGNSTNSSNTFSVQRSTSVFAYGMINGINVSGNSTLITNDLSVNVTATPPIIQSGQSSTLNSDVSLETGLETTFEAGNNQEGAMLDVIIKKALDLKGVTVYLLEGSNSTADVEVYYKTGTYVGSEGNASDWTNIASQTGLAVGGSVYIPFSNPISAVAGQTLGFYVTRTDGDYVAYSNGTTLGATYTSDANMEIEEGIGLQHPFGTTYSPRILNAIFHYAVDSPSGVTYSWSPGGGSSGSKSVSPTVTTNYTVTVTKDNCSENASAEVQVGNIGIHEDFAKEIQVFPNPAQTVLNLTFNDNLPGLQISLTDISGRVVFTTTLDKSSTEFSIPVEQYVSGMYILNVRAEGRSAFYRIQIL